MKKGRFFVLGMLALALALSGCDTGGDEPNNEPKTIVITGFSLQGKTDIKVYQVSSIYEMDLGNDTTVYGGAGPDLTGDIAIERYNKDGKPWTGTGKYYIYLQVSPANGGKGRSGYFYSSDGKNPAQVNIKDKVTKLEWSKFVYFREDSNAG